ncbi:hypothetical protein AMECASPLE_010234 [Ameca splendens]|uniref:Uncharacterized protein n=1 Tax=Ameca splendens TaxID=208324 RepID=A0ABV0XDG7_9TELE
MGDPGRINTVLLFRSRNKWHDLAALDLVSFPVNHHLTLAHDVMQHTHTWKHKHTNEQVVDLTHSLYAVHVFHTLFLSVWLFNVYPD